MEDFGRYLRSLREARGLSRTDLRDQIRDRFVDARGLSTKTLENWEGGTIKGMSAGALARLAVVLEADYEDMFSRLVAAQQLAAQADHAPGAARPHAADQKGHRRRPGTGSKRSER